MEDKVDNVMMELGDQGMMLTKLAGWLEQGDTAVISKDEHSSFSGCEDIEVQRISCREIIAMHYPSALFLH